MTPLDHKNILAKDIRIYSCRILSADDTSQKSYPLDIAPPGTGIVYVYMKHTGVVPRSKLGPEFRVM